MKTTAAQIATAALVAALFVGGYITLVVLLP